MSRSCSGPRPARSPRRRPRLRPGFAPEAPGALAAGTLAAGALAAGALAADALAAGRLGAGPPRLAAWGRACLDAGLAAASAVLVRRLGLVMIMWARGRRWYSSPREKVSS